MCSSIPIIDPTIPRTSPRPSSRGPCAPTSRLTRAQASVPTAAAVVMFTADTASTAEARAGESARSRAASFFAVLDKPFDLDELLATVARAVGRAVPFDASPAAETAGTAALVAGLEAAGARQIRPGVRREWATFTAPDGACVQLYWRQRDGTYHVVRCTAPVRALECIGRFPDLDAAVALAMVGHQIR